MCARYVLSTSLPVLGELLSFDDGPALSPRYNIAPTTEVPAVRPRSPGPGRELALLRWGLVPSWAKDATIGAQLINARAETLFEKPSFRTAARRRRCLVPADGFYEWKKTPPRNRPFFARMKAGSPFAIAGLWEAWSPSGGPSVATCTLVTTAANDLLRPIHDRMPVILDPADYALWLDPEVTDPAKLAPLLRPYPAERMDAYPVGFPVGNVRNDSPALIRPLDPPGPGGGQEPELF